MVQSLNASYQNMLPFLGIIFTFGTIAALLIAVFIGRVFFMWWSGMNEVLAELRTIAGELRTLRVELAQRQRTPPPAL